MKIYKIERREEFTDYGDHGSHPWAPWYDKKVGMVVVSDSEQGARNLAAEAAGDEGVDAWLLEKWSTCVEIDTSAEHVVLVDFHAA